MKMYKDILWIDDIDNSDSDAADLEDEYEEDISLYSDEMLSDEDKESLIKQDDSLSPYAQRIKLCRKMLSACHEIDTNYRRYNLVIFDMNMTKGWINRADDIKKLSEILSKNKINGYGHDTKEDKIAGIYLYLLLLNKGYPADRMIIYTGNSTDSLKSHFSYLKLDNIVKYKGDGKDTLDLETSYYPENSYYRIRRLVLQACDYWKKDIANKKDQDIPFNKIYFSKDTDKQISTENFKELLERVEMMFPVIQPASPEKVYYQAARILCEYHENKADIKILLKKVLYPFHMVCRNFRNWSSHNKFKDTQMPADIFALLLCITLRTYFDTEQKENEKFSDNVNDYEKIYFSGRTNVPPNNEKINGKISYIINDIPVKKIFFEKYSTEKIICSELLYKWGEIIDKNDIGDIFLSILFKNHTIKFNTEDFEKLFKTIFENDNQIDGKIFEVTINEIPIDNNKFTDLSFSETYRICYKNNNT